MTIRPLAHLTALAALLAVAVAQAQTAPPITDVGPPPAEERASTGAVVLEKSPVPALRDKLLTDTATSGAAPAPVTDKVVRSPTRAQTRAQTRAAKARARSAENAELRRSGAGSLTGR